jgi:choline dehydrogenase-like flavoprotein
LRVVALEAGKHWNPARDFATDERSQSKLFWNDERLSAGQDPLHFGSNNSGIGVGGSTLHYTAYTPRAQGDDLRLRTEFGVGRDWCLSYEEIEPYYEELESFLGVSGPAAYPWGTPRRKPYALAPLPLNGAAQLMERACREMNIRTAPAPNAALSAPYYQDDLGWRAACTNRGFCQAGCTTGAKASMDVTFIPLALAAGAEVRAECFVTNFERDSYGRITGVVYVHDGREERQTVSQRVPLRRSSRDAALAAHQRPREFKRAGRQEFHGAYGRAGVGKIRRRRAPLQRHSRQPYLGRHASPARQIRG